MALIPFAAFAVAFFGGAMALWFIAKRTKISQIDGKSGTATHVDSPLGTLDVRQEAKLDARLAGIPLYPGAMPQNPGAAQTTDQATRVPAAFRTGQSLLRMRQLQYRDPRGAECPSSA
jgi:hypothetical protein